jgi:hypothetical protein
MAETRNIFAPLRTTDMYIDTSGTEAMLLEEPVPTRTGTLPPIILTSTFNLIHLQKQLKGLIKENFEFRSTRN